MTAPRVIKKIDFIGSFPTAPQSNGLPEIAFVGRSNVGKSVPSTVCSTKEDCSSFFYAWPCSIHQHTRSMTPRFVDLPDAGFAKVPIRFGMGKMIGGYLVNRAAPVGCRSGRWSTQRSKSRPTNAWDIGQQRHAGVVVAKGLFETKSAGSTTEWKVSYHLRYVHSICHQIRFGRCLRRRICFGHQG